METPRDYGLDHEEWRPNQYEIVQRALGAKAGKVLFLEAPTGSGKTAIARAVSSKHSVCALAHTKMLQVANYDKTYRFDALFGRGNYPCALDSELTGAECQYADGDGMSKCPSSKECPYLVKKKAVIGSSCRSLNYAYWLTARWPKEYPSEFLFLDEAHRLSDETLDRAGITITDHELREWGLPALPHLASRGGLRVISASGVYSSSDAPGIALEWLKAARDRLREVFSALDAKVKGGNKDLVKRLRACENLGRKVTATIDALEANGQDWFIRSGPEARTYRRKKVPGFIAKPLTAKYHFSRYFIRDEYATIAMSATIGDFDTFAGELGLSGYDTVRVPSPWAASVRPVMTFKDAPKLGEASKRDPEQKAFDKQADIMAKLLKALPAEWTGVVHSTSKIEAKKLSGRLAARGFERRVWTPPDGGTDKQIMAWDAAKRKHAGLIAFTYSWHEGVDLFDEKICICAKVPFPFLGEEYERERFSYSHSFYSQRAAWMLEQCLGRVRRGRPEDYDLNGSRQKIVAILDNNWTRVKKYLSASFVESIIEF